MPPKKKGTREIMRNFEEEYYEISGEHAQLKRELTLRKWLNVCMGLSVVCALFLLFATITEVHSKDIIIENLQAKISQQRDQLIDTGLKMEEANSLAAENSALLKQAIDMAEEYLVRIDELTRQLEISKEDNATALFENKVLKEYYFRQTGKEIDEIKQVDIEATKYTNAEGWFEKGDPNYGMTASGYFTRDGVVAAPDSVPFGSTVLLAKVDSPQDQSKIFTVLDRGSAIVEDETGEICIDIWTPEENIAEAYAFGRQHIEGFIILPKK